MAKISPYGKFFAFGRDNEPLPYAKLYTYEAGTTTPKATYTDASGNTANPWPVVMNEYGYEDVWLDIGGYKFVLDDRNDVNQWSTDNIDGGGASGFASQVITTSTGITLTSTYQNAVIVCTQAVTLSLVSAAVAGDGYVAVIINRSSGNVTIAPDGSDTINGASSFVIYPNGSATIHTDGVTWYVSSDGQKEIQDDEFRVIGSVDITKKLAFEVDGLTTATTRTLTAQDANGTIYITGGQDVSVADGGTGLSSYTAGDTLYASDATTLTKLAKGTAGQGLVMNTGATAPTWFTPGQTFVVQDQKASGTAGGGSTAGSWLIRVLNTSITNTISGASLSSNQITLPAGTYRVQGHGTFFQVGAQNRFYNVTDAVEVVRGNTAASGNANSNTAISAFSNTFTITGTKVFELQYRSNTTNATNSLGLAATLGVNEIYAHVEITKISD